MIDNCFLIKRLIVAIIYGVNLMKLFPNNNEISQF